MKLRLVFAIVVLGYACVMLFLYKTPLSSYELNTVNVTSISCTFDDNFTLFIQNSGNMEISMSRLIIEIDGSKIACSSSVNIMPGSIEVCITNKTVTKGLHSVIVYGPVSKQISKVRCE